MSEIGVFFMCLGVAVVVDLVGFIVTDRIRARRWRRLRRRRQNIEKNLDEIRRKYVERITRKVEK